MTKKEQARFIRELIRSVKRDLLAVVPKIPPTWDGHELRQLIADRFDLASWTLRERENRQRYRAYKNEVLVRNLL